MPTEGKLILARFRPEWRAGTSSHAPALQSKPVLNLAELTRRTLLLTGLRTRDGMEVLRSLCDALAGEELVTDASQFFSTAMNREITCNTAVAPEWAIPHVRSSHCERLCMAVATCPSGVNWFGTAGVRAVFLFGVPEQEAMTYMFAVSALARVSLTPDPEHLARIGQAQDPEALLGVLASIYLKPPAAKPGSIVN